MDNATTSSLIELWKTSASSSRRLLKRLLTTVISSLRVSKRGGVSGHAANYPWVPLNPRYLGKAMQHHQALKTIKYILRTNPFNDQRPTVQVQEAKARAQAFKVNGDRVEVRRWSAGVASRRWNTILVLLQSQIKAWPYRPAIVCDGRMRIICCTCLCVVRPSLPNLLPIDCNSSSPLSSSVCG